MHTARYIAEFNAESWVGGYAFSVDPGGDTTWDCTDYLRRIFAEHVPHQKSAYREEIVNEMIAENFEFVDVDDVLQGDPAAPEWVRKWSGPFTITVRRPFDGE